MAILKDKDKALLDNLGKKRSITISPDIVFSFFTFWLRAFWPALACYLAPERAVKLIKLCKLIYL